MYVCMYVRMYVYTSSTSAGDPTSFPILSAKCNSLTALVLCCSRMCVRAQHTSARPSISASCGMLMLIGLFCHMNRSLLTLPHTAVGGISGNEEGGHLTRILDPTRICVYTHIYIHQHTHTHKQCIYTYIYTYKRMNTHIYIHTRTSSSRARRRYCSKCSNAESKLSTDKCAPPRYPRACASSATFWICLATWRYFSCHLICRVQVGVWFRVWFGG